MDAIGICSLLPHIAMPLACSEEVNIFPQAMKQRFQIFLVDTALLCEITSKDLLLSSTLVPISGES